MRTITLAGQSVPALGQGTWNMGDDPRRHDQEVRALQTGIDLGMTLIDTAEMYAEGGAEEVIAEAVRGRRQDVFLVSKVYPHNATRRGTADACERSLKRLGTDHLDLYLLHWRGAVPLAETLEALTQLTQAGKILAYGVSNFDTPDLQKAWTMPGAQHIATDQILYNLIRRGIEFDLLPWCSEHKMPVMAYSPVEQGRLLANGALIDIATARNATPAQVALAWVLSRDQVIAIPQSSNAAHVAENREAAGFTLTREELAALDKAFPAPARKKPLEML